MSSWRLVLRSLRHYWRSNLAVVAALAVATAVIVGSLAMGDSLRGSLRRQALQRLGRIDQALVAEHYFSAKLAEAGPLNQIATCDAALVTSGAARADESGAAAPRVQVVGVDSGFWKLFPDAQPLELSGRQVAINAALASDLAIKKGDALILYLDRQRSVRGGTMFTQRDWSQTRRTLRVEVAEILLERGGGAFSLDAGTGTPRNVFISRDWLAAQLGKKGQANAIFAANGAAPDARDALKAAMRKSASLSDYGLRLVPSADGATISLQSDSLLLDAGEVKSARQCAPAGTAAQLSSLYLASRIARADDSARHISYAVMAALDPVPPAGFSFAAGGGPLDDGGIWLNTWAAEDLGAKAGDRLSVKWLSALPDGTFREDSAELAVRGIVRIEGLAADQTLVPAIEGVTDVRRLDEWAEAAPFPFEPSAVTPRDDEYWDRYRATPKAFVSPGLLQRMWAAGGAGAGWVTSVRFPVPAGMPADRLQATLEQSLLQAIAPASQRLAFRPVRQMALQASAGTTDFSVLFLSMSFFLVLSAGALAAGLMRLLVERRASEMGLMLACGLRPKQAGRMVLAEGLALALAAAALGVPLGLAYGRLLLAGLSHWWRGPWEQVALQFEVDPLNVLIGAVAGLALAMVCAAWGLRAMRRLSALQLLAGWRSFSLRPAPGARRLPSLVTLAILLIATIAMLTLASSGKTAPAGAFFTAGACLLIGGLLIGRMGLARAMRIGGVVSVPLLALRSAAAYRGRSLLAVGLFAAAAFILVAVAANRRDPMRADVHRRESGAGGFSLRATTSLPLRYDLGSAEGRRKLGFSESDEQSLAGATIVSLLSSGGEDISCLNLARPQRPRILGVPRQLIDRGGFSPQVAGDGSANSWAVLAAPGGGEINVFGDADSVMWSLHSGLGKTVPLPLAEGHANLRIAGLLPGSIFAGELLMDEGQFRRLFPSVAGPTVFLVDAPAGKEAAVAATLRRALGEAGMEVRDTREILASYLNVQNVYLSIFMGLGGMGVLLGTVGMVCVIFRNAVERRREMAILTATGTPRGRLVDMIVLENFAAMLAGLLLGAAAALVAMAPALASAQTTPSWRPLVALLAGVVTVGLVSCILAARWAIATNPLAGLRQE